jgi:hypothetical protein
MFITKWYLYAKIYETHGIQYANKILVCPLVLFHLLMNKILRDIKSDMK